MKNEKLLDSINQSGFPLQIAVAYVVEETVREHGWRVVYKEHSWTNELDRNEGFLDLVLKNRHDTSALAVECKRVLESTWAFLIPEARPEARSRAKAWLNGYESGGKDPTGSFTFSGWADIALDPRSPEAMFCVVPGQDTKSRPMLERAAAELVSATEALALEEKPLQARAKAHLSMFFSAIVTTAKLKVCKFDSADISIADGVISKAEFSEVPFVRFRKQLSTRTVPAVDRDSGDAFLTLELAKEHTVFVVNSECFVEFLKEFEVNNNSVVRVIIPRA